MKKTLAAAIGIMAAAGVACAQTQKELLDELDRTIEEAETYVTAKELRIKTIENSLHSRGVSPERQYLIYGELFDEYQPFNYGETAEVEFSLPVSDLAFWNIDDKFVVEPGDFLLWAATDSTSGEPVGFTVR